MTDSRSSPFLHTVKMKLLFALFALFLVHAASGQEHPPGPHPNMTDNHIMINNTVDPLLTIDYPMECDSWFCTSGASAVSSPTVLVVALALPLIQQVLQALTRV
ncbi:hypothetical protein AALO_G00071540 [Alosa alosa]|uniref:Uncharacterized protein n=1 Tax=Alosa alosa TaxID=278164 RepID=A0AAV6H5V8_9TELE|nr:hypothetical protein AALO_G00071540 [Alosa alosa]